jgi:hypothetical protein
MTTDVPLNVAVEVKPNKLTINVNPFANQVSVNAERNEVEIRSPGIQGASGITTIGGYGFDIQSLAEGDILQFGGEAWVNTPQTEMTDGGNF